MQSLHENTDMTNQDEWIKIDSIYANSLHFQFSWQLISIGKSKMYLITKMFHPPIESSNLLCRDGAATTTQSSIVQFVKCVYCV